MTPKSVSPGDTPLVENQWSVGEDRRGLCVFRGSVWTCTMKYSWNSAIEALRGKSLGPGRDQAALSMVSERAEGRNLTPPRRPPVELLWRTFARGLCTRSPFSCVSGVWLQARSLICPLVLLYTHSSLRRTGPSACTKWDFYLK